MSPLFLVSAISSHSNQLIAEVEQIQFSSALYNLHHESLLEVEGLSTIFPDSSFLERCWVSSSQLALWLMRFDMIGEPSACTLAADVSLNVTISD